jgi:hypothetical protein
LYNIVWDLDDIYDIFDKLVSFEVTSSYVNDFIDNEINLSIKPLLQLIHDNAPNAIVLIIGMISFDNSDDITKDKELERDKIILLSERIKKCFHSIINKNKYDDEKINTSCFFIYMNDIIEDIENCGIIEIENEEVLFNKFKDCIKPFIERQIDVIKNIKEIYTENEKNISIDIKESINSSIKELKEKERLFATIDELKIQAFSNQSEQCISYIKLLSSIDQVRNIFLLLLHYFFILFSTLFISF